MIQQPQAILRQHPASSPRGRPPRAARPWARLLAVCAAGLLHLSACRPTLSEVEVPRTLGGKPRLGRFVPPFAYEAYVRGELALMRGDFAAAIDAFELATAAPDEDAYVLSRLAWAYAMAGDDKASARSLAQADKIDPCSEPAFLTRAKLAERKKDYARARDSYAKASECAPHSAEGPIGLSRMLVALGERERAQGVLEAFAARSDRPASFEAALALAISRSDALSVGVALEGLLASGAPHTDALSTAVERALAMQRPLLASELLAHHKGQVSPTLAARVCLSLSDLTCAKAKLAFASIDELGGPTQGVELLLLAGLYERAEVEASVALATLPSARLYLARATARAASGDTEGALGDLSLSEQAEDKERVLVDMLGRADLSGLARSIREKRKP